jgi:hypothetical protein
MAAPVGPKKVHRNKLEFKIQAVRLSNHPESSLGYHSPVEFECLANAQQCAHQIG